VNKTRQLTHRSIVHLLLTIVGTAGIAGLFLPFTEDVSPVDAALDSGLWRLAIPFSLAVLASAASIRWIISGSLSRPERAIAYVASAAIAGVTVSMWFTLDGESRTIQEWLAIDSPGPILALGICLLIRNAKMGPSRNFNPVMAIQVAFLANAVLCLIAFFRDWQVGAYCVLVSAVAFMLQIILASVPGRDIVRSQLAG
jgi:hypothetical protein